MPANSRYFCAVNALGTRLLRFWKEQSIYKSNDRFLKRNLQTASSRAYYFPKKSSCQIMGLIFLARRFLLNMSTINLLRTKDGNALRIGYNGAGKGNEVCPHCPQDFDTIFNSSPSRILSLSGQRHLKDGLKALLKTGVFQCFQTVSLILPSTLQQ